MSMQTMTKEQIYNYVEDCLEDMDFEELLEEFDLTPQETFFALYSRGLIDEDLIILPCDD